jgi:hypothetical protein
MTAPSSSFSIPPKYHLHMSLQRRSWLQAGAASLLGLSWTDLLQARAASTRTVSTDPALAGNGLADSPLPGFGRAKQCLLLFMWGGPSQLETFDPKPLAPDTIRGPGRAIETRVPGIWIGDHFTRLAAHADKFSLIRSLTHDDPAHLSSAHTALTGHLPPVNKSDDVPPSERDTPHLGCVMSRLRPAETGIPSFVTMPWVVSHPAAPGGQAPGQHGGWLGRQYDPLVASGDLTQPHWRLPALELQDGQPLHRLQSRQHLLATLERQQQFAGRGALPARLQHQQDRAFELLSSATIRGAFDLSQESAEQKDRYGRNLHGQCVLLARRLLQHGVPIVSVNWHNDGRNFWDTHGQNFTRLYNDLIPPADRALSALLSDLADSGELDETLVVWVGEFGRHPVINAHAGRDHHPFCYSGLIAGGGVVGGQVYGSSDAHAHRPASQPVAPADLMATVYHALGIDAETTLHDHLNRPHRIVNGRPLIDLFS